MNVVLAAKNFVETVFQQTRSRISTFTCSIGVVIFLLSSTGCFSTGPIPPAGMEIDLTSESRLAPRGELMPVSSIGSSPGDALRMAAPVAVIPPEFFRVFKPIDDSPTSLVVSSSGSHAYLGTRDGRVIQLTRADDVTQMEMSTLVTSDRPIFSLALSADGSKLAFSQYSYVGVIDLNAKKLVSHLTLIEGRILSLAWDGGGELLALGRANGEVVIWDAQDNNTRSIESYSGASSPIVGLEFHPRARALFVLERTGGLYLWRVLRTEYQLGLRDETADVDKAQQGRLFVAIGYLPGASKMWVSDDGEEILAMSQEGQVFGWGVRGLISSPTVDVGTLQSSALAGVRALPPKQTPLMLVGGRGQQLQIWCRSVRPDLARGENLVPVLQEGQALGAPPVVNVAPDDGFLDNPLMVEPPAEEKAPPGLIAISPVVTPTVIGIRTSRESIWVAFGDGSIAELPFITLFSSASVRSRLENCQKVSTPSASVAEVNS